MKINNLVCALIFAAAFLASCDRDAFVAEDENVPDVTPEETINSNCTDTIQIFIIQDGNTAFVAFDDVSPHNIEDYSIEWSTGETTPTITIPEPGNYSVTATDADGCTLTTSSDIPNCDLLQIYGDWIEPIMTLNIRGGVPDYDIVWSTGESGNQIEMPDNIDYSVRVTDAFGCTATKSWSGPICRGLDYTMAWEEPFLTVTAFGGQPEYQYDWNTGENTETIEITPNTSYHVTITDQRGCTIDESFDFTDFGCALGVGLYVTSDYIEALPHNGTPNYSYSWNRGDRTKIIRNLTPGTYYEVTVTDAENCESSIGKVFNL